MESAGGKEDRDEDYLQGDPPLTRSQRFDILVFRLLLHKEEPQFHPVEQIADVPLRAIQAEEALKRVKNRLAQGIGPEGIDLNDPNNNPDNF